MDLSDLKKGATVPGDSGSSPDEKPAWLDMDKFERGKAFFLRHMSPILTALHCSLTVGFSMINLLDPLVFTNNSDTPQKAHDRYTETFIHIALWHLGDVWGGDKEPAFKSVQKVRQMHKRVGVKMNKELPGKRLYVSQYDMALVQTGFFASVLTYPDTFGIRCTKAEQEDYIHFWRGIGYLLGIKDEYNVCSDGTYENTYRLCKQIETEILIPALEDPPKKFAEMADAYVAGTNIHVGFTMHTTKSIMAYSFEAGGLEVPELGYLDTLRVWYMKLMVFLVRYVPGFEWLLNRSALALYRKYAHVIKGATPY